jgi:penicillin-binding protein 1A
MGKRPKKRPLLGRIAFTILVVIPLFVLIEVPIFLGGGTLGAYLVYSHNLPKIPELKAYQPRTVSTFYADDGTVIGIFYKQKRFVVDLVQIPRQVVNAFLAAEDAHFFEHKGIYWMGMLRAFLHNLQALKMVEGGSTITMQVTRNFLLTREKKISRKFKELILATRLEKVWGKKRILHIYLNEIYLGEGCYGVEAAARNYFDKPVEHLSIAEAALIAGLVASPARYNPFKSINLALARQKVVLGRMLRAGFITKKQYEDARVAKLVFRKEIPRPFGIVPDFAEAVRRQVVEKYGADMLYNQGLKVFTTCRIDYQKKAVEAVEKGLSDIRGRHKHFEIVGRVAAEKIGERLAKRSTPALTKGRLFQGVVTRVRKTKKRTEIFLAFSPKLKGRVTLDHPTSLYRRGHILAVRFDKFVDETPFFVLDDHPDLQGALVSIENRTGYVLALVGGASREHFKFNRATQARRQPGSAFKPIIYAGAIEKKSYTPATIIIDEPIIVDMERKEEEWEPRNSGGDFLGPISLRRALELSRNICTVKILMDVGFDIVLDIARKMGIGSSLGRNLSLSLGTSEVSLLELTSAYTVFPDGGIHVHPTMIKRIEDRFGNVLEDNTAVPVLDVERIPHPSPREEFLALDDDTRPEGGLAEFVMGEDGPARSDDPAPSAGRKDRSEPAPDSSVAEDSDPEREGPVLVGPRTPELNQRKVTAALSPQTAYIMTSLLQGGVRSGTGVRMRRYLKRSDLAGKTGTTNNAEDAWFIGFNPEYTTGVWVGFDEKRPLGRREAGSRSALPIWGYYMREILKGRPVKEFPVPPDVTFVEMLTYHGNKKDGFVPMTVEEPVYAPLIGKTLVICPLDPPEALQEYGIGSSYADGRYAPAYPGGPDAIPNGLGYPGVLRNPPGAAVPLRPPDGSGYSTGRYPPPPGTPLQESPGVAAPAPYAPRREEPVPAEREFEREFDRVKEQDRAPRDGRGVRAPMAPELQPQSPTPPSGAAAPGYDQSPNPNPYYRPGRSGSPPDPR